MGIKKKCISAKFVVRTEVHMFITAEQAVPVVGSSLDGLLYNLASKIHDLCELRFT